MFHPNTIKAPLPHMDPIWTPGGLTFLNCGLSTWCNTLKHASYTQTNTSLVEQLKVLALSSLTHTLLNHQALFVSSAISCLHPDFMQLSDLLDHQDNLQENKSQLPIRVENHPKGFHHSSTLGTWPSSRTGRGQKAWLAAHMRPRENGRQKGTLALADFWEEKWRRWEL